MRPSTYMTLLGAGLAIASPIIRNDVMTEFVTETIYATVKGTEPVVTQAHHPTQSHRHHHAASTLSLHPVVIQSTKTQAPLYQPTTSKQAPSAAATPMAETLSASSNLLTGTDFNSTVIYHHNVHRQNHSSPDVSYNSQMAEYAAQVANSCVYAHNLTPGGGGYGQNIAAFGTTNNAAGISSSHIVAQAITDLWYNNELGYYLPSYYGLPNGGGNFEDWGHFSQLVWKSTTGVGCSAVLCSTASSPFTPKMPWWFTVCNYSPPGNMGGQYGINISPPLGDPTVVV